MANPNIEFLLIQDDSCHWYIIPARREHDFRKWLDLDEEDEDSWIVPKYAQELGGRPSLVKFQNPRIK